MKKCMRDGDPTALLKFLANLSRLRNSNTIPYYNDNGVFRYTEEEISKGWFDFLEELSRKPNDFTKLDKEFQAAQDSNNRSKMEEISHKKVTLSAKYRNYGQCRPNIPYCYYTDDHFKLVINGDRVAECRSIIQNDKACGPIDGLHGELLKYAGQSHKTCKLDTALAKL